MSFKSGLASILVLIMLFTSVLQFSPPIKVKGEVIVSIVEFEKKNGYEAELDKSTGELALYKWNREVHLKVKMFDEVKSSMKHKDKHKLKYDDYDVQVYELENGMEYEIILNKKPESNVFYLSIDSKNLVFYYQPPLDAEETVYPDGWTVNATHIYDENWTLMAYRPINVVGSFALYHSSTRDNEYRAGKAFHIYRPKIYDANGDWIWAEYNYEQMESSQLTITIDSDWLEKAKYPVVIDPILGNTTYGGSEWAFGVNYIVGSWASCPESGTATSVSVYLGDRYEAAVNVKASIYQKSDSSLTGNTEAKYFTGDWLEWKTFDIISGGSLTAQDYWMFWWMDANVLMYYDTATDYGAYKSLTYGEWPDPISSLSGIGRRFSIYATYSTEAADATAPTYSDVGTNTTVRNHLALFYTKWADETNLTTGGYIFGTNNTESWVNETWTQFSSGGASDWSNVTKTLNAAVGVRVEWQIWVNDTADNWNTTGLQFLTTTTPTVGTTTDAFSTLDGFQRKDFLTSGRFWVFYCDGSNIVYRTSVDGETWSGSTNVRASTRGFYWSVWFDGTYVHYGYAKETAIYYRRGTPNAGGSISWSAVEQTVSTNIDKAQNPFISVDTSGYVWISYYEFDDPAEDMWVTKSGNNNGTWGATPDGFPYKVSTVNNNWIGTIIPLTAGKMFIVYATTQYVVEGRRWNGSTWGSQRSTTSAIKSSALHSVVAQGDDIYLVFLKSTGYDIIYVNYTWGLDDWGSETVVQAGVTSLSGPVLSINTATNDLYCFWAGSPSANHIYYKKMVDGTWDANPTDWISEPFLKDNEYLTSFYRDYGTKIGLLYMAKASSPYDIKFAFLAVESGELPVNDQGSITDRDDTNKIYAQISGGYTIDYDAHDDDGYASITYILVNLTQGAAVRASFKYNEDTNTFSLFDGATGFGIVLGSCSATRSGDNINLTIAFVVKFGATGEDDLELKGYITDGTDEDTDTLQTDYVDLIVDIVTTFSLDDDRGDISSTVTGSGAITYSGSSLYPPDAEFTGVSVYDSANNNEGTDNSIVNGAWSVPFTAPATVGTDTYNLYIDMVDADYSDGEEAPSDTFITDRGVVYWEQLDDSRVNVSTDIEGRYRIVLDYDETSIDAGSTVSSSFGALSYDAPNTWWEIANTESSVTGVTIGGWILSEPTYGVTTITENITETTYIYDRIKVLWLFSNDTNPDLFDYVLLTGMAELEYDGHEVGSGDTMNLTDATNPPMTWDGDSFVWEVDDIRDANEQVVFDDITGNETTYGITAVNMNGQSATVVWGAKVDTTTIMGAAGIFIIIGIILAPIVAYMVKKG